MPQSWWGTQLQKELSQGDVIRAVSWGTAPPGAPYLKKVSEGGKRAWQESDTFDGDSDGVGYFLARGRVVPCIVLSHDCTIANDGPRARILIAPMFPWSNLNHPDPKYKQSVLNQEQRSLLPLTNVPSLDGDFYGDLRAITFIDRRIIGSGNAARVASMSVEGLTRLQHQLVDFFIRFDVGDEYLAVSRKAEEQEDQKQS
jgi:hypothetical protein